MTTLLERVMSLLANACTTPTRPFCNPTECGTDCVNDGSWYSTNTRTCGGARPAGCEFRRAYRRMRRLHQMFDSDPASGARGGGASFTAGYRSTLTGRVTAMPWRC